MNTTAYSAGPGGKINIEKNFQRLSAAPYDFGHVLRGGECAWPGDFEGRALLAFLCHYHMGGREIPCMRQLMAALPEHTNEYLFIGDVPDGTNVNEQQLSGHNWYLRAMVDWAETFGDDFALRAAKSTFEHLYLPALPFYDRYPLERKRRDGGVDGHINDTLNGWKLSSDVGCAFMCLDGISRYFALTGDSRAAAFIEKTFDIFLRADMVARGFQTHTSLTCLRGALRYYGATGNETYLSDVQNAFDRYLKYGMTLTYENFNWFGRENTWTEPCAVVDSLILATELYRITLQPRYLKLARRIWANGLQFCQRDNGGAGTNKCVTPAQPILMISGYEAPQCCTMRYAEGLRCWYENRELFVYDPDATVVKEPDGRHYADDLMIVEANGKLRPIFSCNTVPKDALERLRLKVLF